MFIQIAQKLTKNISQEDITVKQIREMFIEKKPSFFSKLFKKTSSFAHQIKEGIRLGSFFACQRPIK